MTPFEIRELRIDAEEVESVREDEFPGREGVVEVEDFEGELGVDCEEGGGGEGVGDGGYADGGNGVGCWAGGKKVGVDLVAEFEGEAEEGWEGGHLGAIE